VEQNTNKIQKTVCCCIVWFGTISLKASVALVSQSFVVESAASSSEAVVFRTFMCIIVVTLNVFKGALKWPLKWSVPSRALAESSEQCSTFTNQFISLKARRFA